jgi:signal transduction histidine kinase
MLRWLAERLKNINPWHFLWFAVLSAMILTVAISISVSYALWGRVSHEVLIIGAIDSFFVSLLVTFIVIYLVRKLQLTTTTNIQLLKEIEERKRAEAEKATLYTQLLQVQKMEAVGRLAGGVAHDFNNILSVITGYTDLSLMMLPKDHPLIPKLELIGESAMKAAALTRQLLAFSRKQVLQMKVVNLKETVDKMARMLQPLIGEDIVLEFRAQSPLPDIWADPFQIEQILMNLATNARDAMPTGGILVIETLQLDVTGQNAHEHHNIPPGRYAVLLVKDAGSGMSEEEIKKIFEPFYTSKVTGKGTGLGLATVYGIVKQHRGYVYAESELGSGSTFFVYFPMFRGDVVEDKQQDEVSLQTGEETLLVVEDDTRLRQLLIDMLQPRGYNLLVAGNGAEALKKSRDYDGKIDVLLTDVIMPGMSGREVADTLLAERSDLKVIFMSGYPHDAISKHGVLESEVQFLQKPISMVKLSKTLKSSLG